jgi:hypothetical protein
LNVIIDDLKSLFVLQVLLMMSEWVLLMQDGRTHLSGDSPSKDASDPD